MDAKSSSTHHQALQPLETNPPITSTSPTAKQGIEAFTDILFGSISGAAGKVIEYPFDTVKVRLQSQADHLPLQYKGPLDCFRQSIAADGIGGLYRGVSAPLAGAAAETASLFLSYRLAREVFLSAGLGVVSKKGQSTKNGKKDESELDLSLGMLAVAGAVSGGVTSLILTPIELVKCRMQAPLSSPSTGALTSPVSAAPLSPFKVIAEVYRREGIRGFWRGQLGTFLRESGGSAAWFGSFEAGTAFFKNRRQSASAVEIPWDESLPVSQQMASGALAGMSYNFLFFPADTIKSKIQTGELAPSTSSPSGPSASSASSAVQVQHQRAPTFLSVGKALYRAHGLKGLYRGCGITVARSAPSSALIFTLMEKLKATFG